MCVLTVSNKPPAVQPEVPPVPSLHSVPEPALRAGGGQEGGRGEGQGDQSAPAGAPLPGLGLFLGQAGLRGAQGSDSQGESDEESLLWRQQQGRTGPVFSTLIGRGTTRLGSHWLRGSWCFMP